MIVIDAERTVPRLCSARQVTTFDRAEITRRLYAGRECYGDFMIVEQVARPSVESSFDACCDGHNLYVSVMLFDSGMSQWCDKRTIALDNGVGPNSVEVLISPYGDGIGYLQFGVGPGDDAWFNHHWPYRDGREHLGARPQWLVDCAYEEMGEDLVWVAFFRFSLAGITGTGYAGALGFNVMRTQLRTSESATWSHASGAGFPDASSCGWLKLSEQAADPAPAPRCHRAPVPGVQLQGTFDFPDEMVGGPYTPDTLKHELKALREHGFGRVYWIDYPHWIAETERLCANNSAAPRIDGPWRRIAANHQQTIAAFGGDPMPVCARLAHEQGLEFFTVMKPYDSLNSNFPQSSFARNPAWLATPGKESVKRLTLYADNDLPLPFDAEQVRLYVSHDNAHYRPFAPVRISESVVQRPRYSWSPAGKQPAGGEERVRAIELDGIDFEGGYLAVEFPMAEVAGRFGNQRYLLAEASNAPLRLSQRVNGTDFKNGGFDFYDNGASAGWSDCSEGVELRQAFPSGSTLGIRLGCDAKHDKMPDPAFAEVRQFWLHNWVQRAIESGADGVDVRIAFHTRSDEWLAYAYAEPVLETFRSQCGRDPEPCHDDYGRIRRIRGGFHTQFLRAAKELLGAAGKRLEAHVEARMKTPPEHDTYAHLHWDCATWIDEGIVDGVNLKYLGPYNPFVQQQILPRARRQGIPVHMIGAIGDPRTQPRTPEWAAENLALVQSAGLNGLNLYELWVYLRTSPRGELFYRGSSRSIFTALQQQLAQ